MRSKFFPGLVVIMAVLLAIGLFFSKESLTQTQKSVVRPDSVTLEVTSMTNTYKVSVNLFNSEELAAITVPLRFGDGKGPLVCDSVSFSRTRSANFDFKNAYVDTARQTVLIALLPYMSSKPPLMPGKGSVADIYLSKMKKTKSKATTAVVDTMTLPPHNKLSLVTAETDEYYPAFKNVTIDLKPKKKK